LSRNRISEGVDYSETETAVGRNVKCIIDDDCTSINDAGLAISLQSSAYSANCLGSVILHLIEIDNQLSRRRHS